MLRVMAMERDPPFGHNEVRPPRNTGSGPDSRAFSGQQTWAIGIGKGLRHLAPAGVATADEQHPQTLRIAPRNNSYGVPDAKALPSRDNAAPKSHQRIGEICVHDRSDSGDRPAQVAFGFFR